MYVPVCPLLQARPVDVVGCPACWLVVVVVVVVLVPVGAVEVEVESLVCRRCLVAMARRAGLAHSIAVYRSRLSSRSEGTASAWCNCEVVAEC